MEIKGKRNKKTVVSGKRILQKKQDLDTVTQLDRNSLEHLLMDTLAQNLQLLQLFTPHP